MPSATTLNVSLPAKLKAFVERQVARGGYGSSSEYVRQLIRTAMRRQAQDELEQKLLEGLASGPGREMKEEDWEQLKAQIRSVRQKAQT